MEIAAHARLTSTPQPQGFVDEKSKNLSTSSTLQHDQHENRIRITLAHRYFANIAQGSQLWDFIKDSITGKQRVIDLYQM